MARDYNHLNRWLPEQLERVGISVEQMAQRAGITRAAPYHWLTDKYRPSTQTMVKVCRVLGVPLEEALRQFTPRREGRPPGTQ